MWEVVGFIYHIWALPEDSPQHDTCSDPEESCIKVMFATCWMGLNTICIYLTTRLERKHIRPDVDLSNPTT